MFSDRLRNLRKENKLTQGQLARRVGVSSSAISMYERGEREPDHQTLIRICRELDVGSDYFLMESTEADIFSTRDLESIIRGLREQLRQLDGLMFSGRALTDTDKEQIVTALAIGARLALARFGKEGAQGGSQ